MASKRGRQWAEKGSQMLCGCEDSLRQGGDEVRIRHRDGQPWDASTEFGTREEAEGSRFQNQGHSLETDHEMQLAWEGREKTVPTPP